MSSRVRNSFINLEHDVSGVAIVGLDIPDEQEAPLI